ncbi:hypothetical protein OB919_08365 [Halobacteria archaeon AArc-curdl1]|uniref:Uncharacterized protein n=1 Tax=Natronosalvus hydrolyticus TaxID=2979988 RepID=A0AAP2Z8I6_9EURY|nr:hypothetical protein [Halobacteria archaeon AArc-curdl1]
MQKDDRTRNGRGIRRWGTVVLGAIIGVVRFLAEFVSYTLVYLFAKLIPFFVVVICLGIFFVLFSLLSVLLSPFGISDQAIAAVAAVGILQVYGDSVSESSLESPSSRHSSIV